jgi:hypothetical protein
MSPASYRRCATSHLPQDVTQKNVAIGSGNSRGFAEDLSFSAWEPEYRCSDAEGIKTPPTREGPSNKIITMKRRLPLFANAR